MRRVALIALAAAAAALIGLSLAPHAPLTSSLIRFIFDTTPRTTMSTRELIESFPPESLLLLTLSAIAATMSIVADFCACEHALMLQSGQERGRGF